MHVKDRVVAVTGGAKGIGKGLCERFHREGARKVIVADIDTDGAKAVAASISGAAYRCDVTKEADIVRMIDDVEGQYGPIALFCSNAGAATAFDPFKENAAGDGDDMWTLGWQLHVMAHVYAARALVPRMKARGGGYFLQTVSAAGLLSQIGSAVYSATKHAAVGFAENLAITHRADGIRVSILCPLGVDTPLLRALPTGPMSRDAIMSPRRRCRGRREGPRAGAVPDPVASGSRGLRQEQDRQLRSLDRRHGEAPAPYAGSVEGRQPSGSHGIAARRGGAPVTDRGGVDVGHVNRYLTI
jgi:NAD(P)-dependent dehydrogenase (short-subunit alcohol dehydrogenase family)